MESSRLPLLYHNWPPRARPRNVCICVRMIDEIDFGSGHYCPTIPLLLLDIFATFFICLFCSCFFFAFFENRDKYGQIVVQAASAENAGMKLIKYVKCHALLFSFGFVPMLQQPGQLWRTSWTKISQSMQNTCLHLGQRNCPDAPATGSTLSNGIKQEKQCETSPALRGSPNLEYCYSKLFNVLHLPAPYFFKVVNRKQMMIRSCQMWRWHERKSAHITVAR